MVSYKHVWLPVDRGLHPMFVAGPHDIEDPFGCRMRVMDKGPGYARGGHIYPELSIFGGGKV